MQKESIAYKMGYRVIGNDVFSPSGTKLKLAKNSWGYLRFSVNFGGIKRKILFHRMIAFQKYGSSIYGEGLVVRHLDGNCLNNSIDNLALGTASDNMMDIPSEIRLSKAIRATSFIRKHDKSEIRKRRADGASYNDLMNEFGIKGKGQVWWLLNK